MAKIRKTIICLPTNTQPGHKLKVNSDAISQFVLHNSRAPVSNIPIRLIVVSYLLASKFYRRILCLYVLYYFRVLQKFSKIKRLKMSDGSSRELQGSQKENYSAND
jgi:hypothetical protein